MDNKNSSAEKGERTIDAGRIDNIKHPIAAGDEPDSLNDEAGVKKISTPREDEWGDNKVATSIDNE